MIFSTNLKRFTLLLQLAAVGFPQRVGAGDGPGPVTLSPSGAAPEEPEPPPAGFTPSGAPVEPPLPVAAPSAAAATPPLADPGPLPESLPPADPSGSELDLFRLDAALNAAVVTASGGAEEERSTALANVVTVSRADILARGYRSVAEILADVPGLYVIDDFVMPSLAVRGVNGGLAAGTRIVKVMINGQVVGFRPELSAFLGPELLPLDAIERVEIAKGPLSSLYGANAFLATVNVITRRGSVGQGGGQGGGQGLAGELNGRLNVINGNAGGGGSMMLSYRSERGWLLGSVSGERNDRSGILLPRSFAGQTLDRDLLTRQTQADLAAPVSAFVNAGWSSERLGTLAAQLGLQRLDAVSNFRLNSLLTDASRVVINNLYAGLRYDKAWQRGLLTLEAGYATGRPDREYSLELTGNPKYTYRPSYDYHSANLHAEGGYDPLQERLQLRAGFDLEFARETPLYYTQTFRVREGSRMPGETTDLIGEDQARRQDYYGLGAYVRLLSSPSRRLPGLRFSADVRADKIWFGPIEFEPQLSARAGLAYKFSPRLATKLFGGRAFQTPSGSLLFGFPGFGNANNVIGNANRGGAEPLRPQVVDSVEAALSGTPLRQLALEASFYYQRLQDKIEFLQVGPDFFAANRGTQHSVGFEASAQTSVGRFTGYLWGAFNWSVGQRAENPPPLYPNIVAAAGIDIDVPEAYAHLHARAKVVGPRGPSQSNIYLNNGEPYQLASYVTMDVTLSTKGLHLFGPRSETRLLASARNVTDSRWIEPGFGGIDLPNVGQTYFFECKQTF